MGVFSPSGSLGKSLKVKNLSWSWNGFGEILFAFDEGEFAGAVEAFLWIMVSFYCSSACIGAEASEGEQQIMGWWGKCGIWRVYSLSLSVKLRDCFQFFPFLGGEFLKFCIPEFTFTIFSYTFSYVVHRCYECENIWNLKLLMEF